MIRPTTVLCMAAAFGSGLYLYAEKHRTAMLDRDIGRVFRATQVAHERTSLLRAEWAVLNEPGRLQELSDRYLALKPLVPSQYVQLADLAGHLPAPAETPPAGVANDDASAPAAPETAAADVPAGAAPGEQAPAQVAQDSHAADATLPAANPAPRLVAKLEPRAHAMQHHLALASTEPPHDALMPRGTPLPLAAPQPVGASTMSVIARPVRQTRRATIVAAVPAYPTAVPFVGSALGGRPSLPPPIPYGAGVQ